MVIRIFGKKITMAVTTMVRTNCSEMAGRRGLIIVFCAAKLQRYSISDKPEKQKSC